jgi:hypothetical protein
MLYPRRRGQGNRLGGAYDPSVGDYADTSPFEWGGFPSSYAKCGAISFMKRSICSFTCACGFCP